VLRPRRPALLLSLGALLVSTLLVLPTHATAAGDAGTSAVRETAPRPNIILITTDDQTLEEMRFLPRTRELIGDEGLTFSRMLSPHPLCCPARAELLTGQFAQNNGVHTNGGPYGGYPALESPGDTLPAWLSAQGYHTAFAGKFLNKWRPSEHGVPPGWDEFAASPVDSFGYYDFSMYDNGVTTSYDDGETYSTTYVTDSVVGSLRDWAATDLTGSQPFFAWASYYAPHGDCRRSENGCKTPPTPEKQYADKFRGLRSPAVGKDSFRARLVRPNPVVEGRKRLRAGKMNTFYRERARSLVSVDDGVSRIVSELEDLGVLDETYLVFTSDNGYLLGEHRYVGKVLAYDEALRVPLLVRGPGVEPGSRWDGWATTVDIASTLGRLAGAAPARTWDGRDLLALADGPDDVTDTILVQAGSHPNRPEKGPWMFRGVRTDRWTFTRWRDGSVELFDNRRDPEQIQNVARRKAWRDVRRELDRRTRTLKSCSGPSECFRSFGREPRPPRR
jgi:arylsulfatase A-like enzyme